MDEVRTTDQDVDYAVGQAVALYHLGNKSGAIKTFARLLEVAETPDVASALRGLYDAANNYGIDQFEAHLRLFARNHIPGYGYRPTVAL